MFTGSIDYTVCSTDEEKYNRINCNLTAPITKYADMTVTCLTTNCNIVVLNESDYIMINGKQSSLNRDYTNQNSLTFVTLLNKQFELAAEQTQTEFRTKSSGKAVAQDEKKYYAGLDDAERFSLFSNKRFRIDRMTYNFKLLTGFYNIQSFPIHADYNEKTSLYFIKAKSVGFTLSTPVLYLVSNVGMQSYRNLNQNNLTGAKIVMRLNNSFSSSSPIIVNNADFTTTILSNDLSSLEFTLVDACMHEIKLLSPMYLSINIRTVKDEVIPSSFALSVMQQEQEDKNNPRS